MKEKQQGELDGSLENYRLSLSLGEELGDKHRIALSLGNIGEIYYRNKAFHKALRQSRRMIQIDPDNNVGNTIFNQITKQIKRSESNR